ncbi:hypothetical protein HX001_08550 [Empedobacter brevis]|uniref:Lipoprotein n=2 Tax=Empedobacter brevis TaxID=247 RepID=A0A511NH65_9FLAO|nr:hypothetical protein [Empedobacter brevis]MDM1072538.1 hypothetical protein [Empedobacter brevis]QES92663.1 hypothetical protein F0358_08010 [Empedobacter brevis]QHC84417.1 hypothetical protein AS589_06255 [Empedobacter brevis]GEM52144.1 hypothetical protein EB1_19340 [Empedobacter brevis NBRC 14943 = ATCC 43319]
MKKLILLVAVAAFATSCNSKASVNHGVLPVVHEPATAEEMHHKSEAAHAAHDGEHAQAAEEKHEEVKDSTKTVETPKTEKKDTVKAGH